MSYPNKRLTMSATLWARPSRSHRRRVRTALAARPAPERNRVRREMAETSVLVTPGLRSEYRLRRLKRQRREGQSRIGATRCGKSAGSDDGEIAHAMMDQVGIDNRCRRITAHHGRALQMGVTAGRGVFDP